MQPLKLYWSSSKKNFGDWLSPAICEILSGRSIEHAPPNKCDMVAVGSILGRIKQGWFSRRIHIWGAGFIEEQPPIASKHYYHAVRGHKTADRLKAVHIQAFGDPGLLCGLLLPQHKSVVKKYALGIVPHYKDRNDPAVQAFAAQNPGTKVLNVFSEPMEFLREMAACEFVLSSSLHGLIAADAFEIPNAWIKLSDNVRGNDFKFLDYYSVFGFEKPAQFSLGPHLTRAAIEEAVKKYQRPNLPAIKQQLIESFPFLASRVI